MNRADEHLLYEELAAGYALSALEPEEEELFVAHLSGCARCARDVEQHREVMASMALAADDAEPPPSLLDGIRAGVLASGRATSLPPRVEGGSDLAEAPDVEPAPGPAQDDLADARRRREERGRRAARWTGIAAAAALVVSLGVWNADLRADRDAVEERGGRLAAAVRDLSRPGTDRVPLTTSEGDVVAVAMVLDREMSLVVDGLSPNDEGTTYVLWAQAPSGDVRPVGAFDVEQQGVDVVGGLQVDEGLDGVSALLVSREDGDVAPPAPGGPVLASGQA